MVVKNLAFLFVAGGHTKWLSYGEEELDKFSKCQTYNSAIPPQVNALKELKTGFKQKFTDNFYRSIIPNRLKIEITPVWLIGKENVVISM